MLSSFGQAADAVVAAVNAHEAKMSALDARVAKLEAAPAPVPMKEVLITEAQEAAILAVPLGGTFDLKGPNQVIRCIVSG